MTKKKIKLKLNMEDFNKDEDLVSNIDSRYEKIDSNLKEMQIIQENINNINENILKNRQATVRLESIKQKLNSNIITPITAHYVAESISNNIDIHDGDVALDTDKAFDESKLDAQIVLEDIAKVETHAQAGFFNLLSGSAIMSSYKYIKYKKAMEELKKLLAETTQLVNTVVMAETPVYEYVPPKRYMEKFLYVSKSLDDGLKSLKTDICEALIEQTQSIENFITDTQDWFFENSTKLFSGKRGIFSTYKLDIKRCTHNYTVYNRSVGYRVPDTDMMFYKGREMPGGKCIYVQLDPNMSDGYDDASEAIACVGKTKWIMDVSDPKLYYPKRIRYFNSLSDSFLSFGANMLFSKIGKVINVITGKPMSEYAKSDLLVAVNLILIGGAYRVVGRFLVGHTGTPNKVVKLEKDLLIKTLSRQEMKKTLKDVSEIIDVTEEWRRSVSKQAFIDTKKLIPLINQEYGERSLSSYVSKNHKSADRFLFELIKKASDGDCGADIHAIEVCTSLLKLIKDSILMHAMRE